MSENGSPDDALADALKAWQEANLPHFHEPGMQVAITWLTQEGGKAKPMADYYALRGIDQDALRRAVSILSQHDLVSITRDGGELLARPSPKLRRLMKHYAAMLAQSVS